MGQVRHDVTATVFDGKDTIHLSKFEAVSIADTFTDPLGSYTITASGALRGQLSERGPGGEKVNEYFKALRRGNDIQILIDGVVQATGRIQKVVYEIDPRSGWTITATAESLLSNSSVGNLEKDIHISSSTAKKIQDAILVAMKPYGFTKIAPIEADTAYRKRLLTSANVKVWKRELRNNQCRPAPGPDAKESETEKIKIEGMKLSDLASKPDDTAYGFSQRILNKLGLILKVDDNGELYTTRPDYASDAMYRVVVSPDVTIPGVRAMGKFTYTEDNTKGYEESIVFTTPTEDACGNKLGPIGAIVKAKDLVKGTPERAKYYSKIETPLFQYKPRRYKDKHAHDKVMGRNSAIINLQRGTEDSINIQCTVPGFKGGFGSKSNEWDAFWTPNTCVEVTATQFGLDEVWWIYSREFVQSASEGQYTRLKIIPKYALQIGDTAEP